MKRSQIYDNYENGIIASDQGVNGIFMNPNKSESADT